MSNCLSYAKVEKMIISLIVPVYNVENELSRCLDSIINQTYKNIEIVLVNDGSTDDSLCICESYKKKDSRIRIVNKENGGLSDARNAGLLTSAGEYVAFIDSDDFIDINTCENIVKCIEKDPDVLVCNFYIQENNKNNIVKHTNLSENRIYNSEEYALKAFEKNEFRLEAVSYIYKREFLLNNNLFFKKGIYHEDAELIPKVLFCAKKICYMDFPFYHYVIRKGSIMNNNDNLAKRKEDVFSIYREWQVLTGSLINKRQKRFFVLFRARCFVRTCLDLNVYDPDYSISSKMEILCSSKNLIYLIRNCIFIISPFVSCKIERIRKEII